MSNRCFCVETYKYKDSSNDFFLEVLEVSLAREIGTTIRINNIVTIENK
jgi:hypothetical protein